VERYCGVYYSHNNADPRRHLSREMLSIETFIDLNGPSLAHADSLCSDALDRRFGDQPWHFHPTSL
jgi:hypothetical protein